MLEYRAHKTAPLLSGDLQRIEQCLDDSWPLSEIRATYGYSEMSVNKHFPGRAMPLKEAASLGWLARKHNQGTLRGQVAA